MSNPPHPHISEDIINKYRVALARNFYQGDVRYRNNQIAALRDGKPVSGGDLVAFQFRISYEHDYDTVSTANLHCEADYRARIKELEEDIRAFEAEKNAIVKVIEELIRARDRKSEMKRTNEKGGH